MSTAQFFVLLGMIAFVGSSTTPTDKPDFAVFLTLVSGALFGCAIGEAWFL